MRIVIPLAPSPADVDFELSPILWARVLEKSFADLTRGGPNFISAVVFFFGSPEVSSLEIACPGSAAMEATRKRARKILATRRLTPEKVLAQQVRIVRDIARGKFVFPPEKARELKRSLTRRPSRPPAPRVH